MSVAGKLFGMWALGKTVSSTTPLFMRLLLGMAALTACALIITLLASMLVIGGLWLIYSQMVAYGMEPGIAQLIVASLILALLASAVLSARIYWRKSRKVIARIQYLQTPLSGRLTDKINDLTNAFMDGYHTPRPSKSK